MTLNLTRAGNEGGAQVHNGSDTDAPGPLITLFVPLLMFATGVLGNLVALVLLWRSRRDHSRSVFYRLVGGLALTDLLGILATSPVTIIVYSKDRQWVGGQAVCDYFSFMMIFSGLATVLVVGCLAVERFLAILHPYTYERRVSPERANATLGAVWVVSALFSCLPLMKVGHNVLHWPGTWCFFDFYSDRTVDKVFAFTFAIIGLLVIAATAVCNVAVMIVLLRMRRISKNIGKSREGRTLNMTSEMQMIFFLAGIILVFAACYAPLTIRIVLNVTGVVAKDEDWDLLAIRLASVNQIMDPWVYLLFRRRLAGLLYSACKSVSPLHTLSSLKALRGTPELIRGTSFKNVTGLRISPIANGVDVAALDTPSGSDSPGLRPHSSDRGGVGAGEAGRKVSACLGQVPRPSGEPLGEVKSDHRAVSVEKGDDGAGEVAAVEKVFVGRGDGDCFCLLNGDTGGGNCDKDLDPERRVRKTSCENPALTLEGDDWCCAKDERAQHCGQPSSQSLLHKKYARFPVLKREQFRDKKSEQFMDKESEQFRDKESEQFRDKESEQFRDKMTECERPGNTANGTPTVPSSHVSNCSRWPLRSTTRGCATNENPIESNRDCKHKRKVSLGIPAIHLDRKMARKDAKCRSAIAKLTSSASWPVISRHGNRAVTCTLESEEDPPMTDCLPAIRKKRHSHLETDCFPLLNNARHSHTEAPCKWCQYFADQPFSFV